jgi:hypothetical protein
MGQHDEATYMCKMAYYLMPPWLDHTHYIHSAMEYRCKEFADI